MDPAFRFPRWAWAPPLISAQNSLGLSQLFKILLGLYLLDYGKTKFAGEQAVRRQVKPQQSGLLKIEYVGSDSLGRSLLYSAFF
jgi:hypothetical protein